MTRRETAELPEPQHVSTNVKADALCLEGSAGDGTLKVYFN